MNAAGGLCYDRYGDGEWLVRIGPPGGVPILFIPPLFEELNRTRALAITIMRRLAGRGFCSILPDLPGTGESPATLSAVGWEDWRDAVRIASNSFGAPPLVASFRGGALLDDAAEARVRWRFAPVAGASLHRDLSRTALAGGAALGGYPIGEPMLESLRAAVPAPNHVARTVRLESDAGDAELKVAGPAIWRRSEPANAPQLAQAMAEDIADWAETCARF